MQAFLTQPLHKAVQQCPQAGALSFGELNFSYAALSDRVARPASASCVRRLIAATSIC